MGGGAVVEGGGGDSIDGDEEGLNEEDEGEVAAKVVAVEIFFFQNHIVFIIVDIIRLKNNLNLKFESRPLFKSNFDRVRNQYHEL